MILGNRYWVAFPIRKNGGYRLQEIIAMTDKYILLQYWDYHNYLYVYDYDGNILEKRVGYIYGNGYKVKQANQKALNPIRTYFSICAPLIRMFEKNVEDVKMLTDGIEAYHCDGAPEMKKFLATFKDKRIRTDD